MALHVTERAPNGLLDGAALVPVPGREERRRRRGLDPAQCLARALARRTGAPVADCLVRADAGGGRQLGRARSARRGGRHAVRVAGPLPRGRLVLVDDVHTTGATLDACARALRAAGSLQLAAVTYVRTLTAA
jgi:predicted amidophosphoribosyltransferase